MSGRSVTKRKSAKDPEAVDLDDARNQEMFTKKGTLNEIEREIAWWAEMCLKDADDDDVVDRGRIDWAYVEKHASGCFRSLLKEKKEDPRWDLHKKDLLVRSSKREDFNRYRAFIRQAFKEGYDPYESYDSDGTTSESCDDNSDGSGKRRKVDTSKNGKRGERSQYRRQITCVRTAFERGDEVMAAWFEDDVKPVPWFPGTVADYTVIYTHELHGEMRSYNIDFDDGDKTLNLDDYYVISKEDYELEKAVDVGKRKLKGVTNRLGKKQSDDEYAKVKGWYTTKHTGGRTFASLAEAMRAHDRALVEKKGAKVTKTDLNLPMEWEWD